MQSFEASATVQPEGDVRIAGVPFTPGTEVQVTISPKRAAAEKFASAWERLCTQLRSNANLNDLSEEDIQKEIDGYRAGR